MPQLLLELFSEEIPARMQANAARDLERLARDHLTAAGFIPEAVKTFAGPRRLTLVVEGLPEAQADRKDERKGPRVGAPDAAIDGFLRSTGLTRDQLTERDGVWYGAIATSGRPTAQIIAEMVEAIVRGFPWPKSMKWGTGSLRWVRPLKRILCLFDGAVVPINIDGIESGDVTEGHRFMGPKTPLKVHDFTSYAAQLKAAYVILDAEERKAIILNAARTLCFARNLELVEDEGLLDEVAGLAEWPTPILGEMNPSFLDLPPEVIRTSMRTHQKYFTVRDPSSGKLAPNFLTVANIEASDGGKAIAAGNARVLSARLNDARFFWDEDRKVPLEDRLEKLKGVTFHAKLGTMYQRVERIEALARVIALFVGADLEAAVLAARLAKADLGTGMVGEFPELQGLMGGYYAQSEGMAGPIADAIRDHYKPQGPNDDVPHGPISTAVALADKLEMLASFFAVDERPTGSRDPYALRRSALGVIRIVLEHKLRVPVSLIVARSRFLLLMSEGNDRIQAIIKATTALNVSIGQGNKPIALDFSEFTKIGLGFTQQQLDQILGKTAGEVVAFLADRLKVLLRDQGTRHDLVDAVFAIGDDDLVRIVARVEALDGLLTTEDGKNLLAGYRRATNILKAEEKKGERPTGTAVAMPTASPEEAALIAALAEVTPTVESFLSLEDFSGAMAFLATLRGPVDACFDKVLVNSDVPEERANRLRLLAQVRDLMGRVADFSLISG
ncbi:glycine--tRNA ligase subunit beta [soil metagenome]